jgi:hypothetical protein
MHSLVMVYVKLDSIDLFPCSVIYPGSTVQADAAVGEHVSSFYSMHSAK